MGVAKNYTQFSNCSTGGMWHPQKSVKAWGNSGAMINERFLFKTWQKSTTNCNAKMVTDEQQMIHIDHHATPSKHKLILSKRIKLACK